MNIYCEECGAPLVNRRKMPLSEQEQLYDLEEENKFYSEGAIIKCPVCFTKYKVHGLDLKYFHSHP